MEPDRDPLTDLDVIEAELTAYGGLEDRPRLVVLNKVDVPDARELADMVRPDARGARPAGLHDLRRQPRGAPRAVLRDGRDGRRRPRRRPDRGADPAGHPAQAARRRGLRRTAGGREHLPGHAARSPSGGSGRPTSPTTRPSVTSPTGWSGSASRRRSSRRARPPAPRWSSARWTTATSSTGSRRSATWPARVRAAPTTGSDYRLWQPALATGSDGGFVTGPSGSGYARRHASWSRWGRPR